MADPASKNGWAQQRGLSGQLKGAVLAAGLGSRMEPLTTRHLPKPVFPLGGKVPMAELWVQRFVASGITDLSMNLCVLKEAIKRHFADGSRFGADIAYVEEETPSGTFGGVCKQVLGSAAKRVSAGEAAVDLPPFQGSTLIVPSGDIVTNFGSDLLAEMVDIHRRAGAAFSMVLVPVPWERRKDFGTVVLDAPESRSGKISKSGRITEFLEKDPDSPSNLNNASIYMIERELLEALDPLRTESAVGVSEPFYDFGKHVFPAMLGRLPYVSLPKDYLLWGVQYDGAWFDVGQKRDYLRVNEQVLDGKIDIELPFERQPWGFLGADTEIDPARVEIVPPVVIGNRCVVEAGATLGPYAVIGDGWTIEKGARIRNSVLWEEVHEGGATAASERRVGAGVSIAESIVVDGPVERDVTEKTVHVAADGRLEIHPLDAVPQGPRA
ncbi:MAG: NDP-sugar synthase [Acidobacteriota bacterium]